MPRKGRPAKADKTWPQFECSGHWVVTNQPPTFFSFMCAERDDEGNMQPKFGYLKVQPDGKIVEVDLNEKPIT